MEDSTLKDELLRLTNENKILEDKIKELDKANTILQGKQGSAIELEKLSIEKEKLIIEQERLRLEKSRRPMNTFIGIMPLLGIIATIFYGIWTQKQADKNLFQLKAAEIMFNAADGYEAKINAEFLKQLFPDKLPKDFSDRFDPDQVSGYDSYLINSKKDLLRLISQNPQSKDEIVTYWKKLFPSDNWPDTLLKK